MYMLAKMNIVNVKMPGSASTMCVPCVHWSCKSAGLHWKYF